MRPPDPPWNPPGLSRISYRIGTWSTFRASMLEQLRVAQPSGTPSPPLADAALQGADDWIAALIDAWAVVGDILTFYQERIANEGYLGTATQPSSVARLFQTIGFPLPRPTAAETHLAFTVSKTTAATSAAAAANAAAGPGSLLMVPAGSAVRSLPVPVRTAVDLDQLVSRLAQAGSAPAPVPAASKLENLVSGAAGTPPPPQPPGTPPAAAPPSPQVFETTQAVAAHPGWNSLQPQVQVRVERQRVRGSTTELRLAGTSTGLSVGQPLLITGEPSPAQAASSYVRTLIAVEADRARGFTWVQWQAPLSDKTGSPPPTPLRRLANARVFAFGKQLPLFGATAKDWNTLPTAVRQGFAPILGGLLRQAATPSGPEWTSACHGLPLDSVNALATSGGALFAGTAAGGVYRSTDEGRHWEEADNGLLLRSLQCLLAAGPPGQVLAGGMGGVFLTTDGGQTWEPLAGGPPRLEQGSPPQVIPTNLPNTVVRALTGWSGFLIAGTDSGIFVYDGAAWSQVAEEAAESPPGPAMGTATYAFAAEPSSPPGLLYAAASDGVYQSADGLTWSLTSPLPDQVQPVRALAAAGGLLFAGGYDGVYRATPSGWSRLTGLDGPVTVLANLGAELYAGTARDGLWSSPDLGMSWTRVPVPLPGPSWPVLALLGDEESLIVATPFDGFEARNWPGFHLQGRQVDLATTDGKIVAGGWVALLQSRAESPPLAAGYAIAKVETVQRQSFQLSATITRLLVTPETGLAGFDLPTTQAWVESQELELETSSLLVPTPVRGRSIELDSQLTTPLPPRQKLIVAGRALNAALLPTQGVLRWTGSSWRDLGLPGAGVTALAKAGRNLYAATAGEGVFLLARRGGSPQALTAGLTSLDVLSLAASQDTVFAGTQGGGVVRWNAAQGSWTSWGLSGQDVAALAAGGAGTLYAAAGEIVYRNPAPGSAAGWQPLPPLASPVLALAIDPENPPENPATGRLTAGTDSGVWSFDGSAWTALGKGLPNPAAAALLYAGGSLYVGTSGAGVFLYDPRENAWKPVGKGLERAQVQALAEFPGGLAAGLWGGAGVQLWDGTRWQPAGTGISNDVQALVAAGGELFAGCGSPSVVTAPQGVQTLAVQALALFVYQPAPGERASLNQGNLPDGLAAAFGAAKTPLSGRATVAPQVRGQLWIVQDQDDAVYFLVSRSATSSIQVSAAGAVLQVTGRPGRVKGYPSGRRWPLADAMGFTGFLDALPGEILLLSARSSDPVGSEVARLKRQEPGPGVPFAALQADDRQRTKLRLEKPLAGYYDAATVTVQANVAHATSGQSVREVLGSGDASKPNQGFQVKRQPVTHVATEAGTARSTLSVTVGGVPWKEVPSLVHAGPDSQIYAATYDAAGFATVTFGDGVKGARLPSGRDNVVAFYRGGGSGPETEVPASHLVQLLATPGSSARVHRVTNPGPAVRPQKGAPPSGRIAPPPGIRTLDRIVAARDFAGLLLTLPGVAGARARRLWTGSGRLTGITVLPAAGQALSPGSALDRQIAATLRRSAAPGTLFQVTAPQSTFFGLKATLWVPAGTSAAARQSLSSAAGQVLADAFGSTGNRLARSVTAAQVMSVLQGVPGVTGALLKALYLQGNQPGLNQELSATDVGWDAREDAVQPAEILLLDTQGGLALRVKDAP